MPRPLSSLPKNQQFKLQDLKLQDPVAYAAVCKQLDIDPGELSAGDRLKSATLGLVGGNVQDPTAQNTGVSPGYSTLSANSPPTGPEQQAALDTAKVGAIQSQNQQDPAIAAKLAATNAAVQRYNDAQNAKLIQLPSVQQQLQQKQAAPSDYSALSGNGYKKDLSDEVARDDD